MNNGALRYNGGQTSSIVYSEIWDNKTSFKGTVEDNVNYAVLATVKVGSTKHTSGWRIGWAKKEADRVWYANETSYYDYDVITTKYISNYIDMVVNGKNYAAQYVLGYHPLKNLRANILITIVLVFISIPLYVLNVNIIIYLLFILYDLTMMLYLYKKLIVHQLDKVLNGGH